MTTLTTLALSDTPVAGMAKTPCQVDPDLWFSEARDDRDYAKAMCYQSCPVREACLEYALQFIPKPEYGVWGGIGARSLRRMDVAA